MAPDLQRFLDAQTATYDQALAELRRGRKESHWIWWIFPQIAGLGRSSTSQRYAISSVEEARAYLAHPVLGVRLRESARTLLATDARTAILLLGPIDAVKLRSSMTLFHRADPAEPLFTAVLDRFFDGRPDDATDALLG